MRVTYTAFLALILLNASFVVGLKSLQNANQIAWDATTDTVPRAAARTTRFGCANHRKKNICADKRAPASIFPRLALHTKV